MITTHILSNGLRLVHVQSNTRVGWCGLVVNAGSRDDYAGSYGLAHFVEHTIFKGTTHRRAWHILNRMETVGGELNAYTTKECTVLYSIFPEQYTERAVELIADLVQCSTFPADELEREKGVVLEEVASYRDTPSEAVYDDFEDMIFGEGSAMGHNILGAEADIEGMGSQLCVDYLKRQYVPGNMAFFYVGPQDSSKVMRLAERYFGMMHHELQRPERVTPIVPAPQQRVVDIDSHQAHTIAGVRIPGMFSEGRFAMSLLNNIIGGPGMNATLNVLMRERRGLVYTVESSLLSFTDCGVLEIYFGCEQNKVKKSLDIVRHTIDQMAQSPLSATRLEAAKRQYCGQLLVASQNMEAIGIDAAKSMLYWERVSGIERTVERIQALTGEDLRQAAEQIAKQELSVLTFQ